MASTPASVSALLKPKANLGRNAFPLDHRQVYSIKAGQITPVKCLKFVPNDYFKVDVNEFCITFPMQTAPFLRGRKETVFYKVYNTAVWSLFNQYIGQRSDPKTSAFNTKLVEPRMKLWDLYKLCLSQFIHYLYIEYYFRGYTNSQSSSGTDEEILNDRFYRAKENLLNQSFTSTNSNMWTPMGDDFGVSYTAFANLGFDMDLEFTPKQIKPSDTSNVTLRDFVYDIVGQYRVYSYVRKLDMLGYGNLYPYFKETENYFKYCYENVSDWSTGFEDFANNISYILSILMNKVLGMTHSWTNPDSTTGMPTQSSNIYPVYQNLYAICAYNLIFYHFFRNSYYDTYYNSRDFNLDFVSTWYTESSNSLNEVHITDFSLRFLDIEYHQWKKDQFTSVLPDTQFGAVSGLSLNLDVNLERTSSSGRYDLVTDNGRLRVSTSLSDGSVPNSWSVGNVSLSGSAQGSFDVIALKRADILQDYRQTLMRAGNKTSDIFTALYGGAPSSEHLDDVIPQFLETFGEDVFIDPVTATANTEAGSNGTLGDLSARGKFGGNSKSFEIKVGHNFGVILALTYFVPTAEYNSYFVDRQNSVLDPEDHYISNFENAGLEPIYSDELNGLLPRNNLKVLGYAPRYHYLKSALDLVHGAFCSLPTGLSLFASASGDIYPGHSRRFDGAFNIWVSPRSDMQNRNATQLMDFYINPAILDNIFVQQVDATQDSDHIICNTYLNIQSTRGMSKVGLMNFV